MAASTETSVQPKSVQDAGKGARVNGKWWKKEKKAFRVRSLGVRTSFKERQEKKLRDDQAKARLKELEDEKETTRQEHIERIKKRREAKAEQERYELLATKMHRKKLDRLKRREKRNKMLKER